MKIKPFYIYGGLVLLAIIYLIVFTPGDSTKENNQKSLSQSGQMPQDDVHKGLSPNAGAEDGNAPSGSNVNESVIKQMQELKSSYEANPSDTLRAREYAEFMAAAHKPDEAISVYEKILSKYPHKTDIRFSLALIYYNKQNYNKAEEIVKNVLGYDKRNAQAKFNLGAIAASNGDKDKAKVYWEEVEKENPSSQLAADARHAIESLGQ